MVNLPKPRAIIYDWDNTLVDTWPIIHAALEKTFLQFGLEPWSFDMVKARVRKSMRDSFPEIFGPNWQDAGAAYQQHYRGIHIHKLTPLEGSKQLLDCMKEAGVTQFVVSNKKGNNLREEIGHLQWTPYFAGICGADDAARDKPHPDPVHCALKGSGFEPGADIWFLGDSDIDLECAKNTGCTPLLYGPVAAAHPEFTPTHFMGFPYNAFVMSHQDMLALYKKHFA